MAIKVYKYGAKPPVQYRAWVLEQMRLANIYRNKLVEIELGRRKAVREYINKFLPQELLSREAELTELIDAATTKLKGDRKKTRSRAQLDPETKEQVAVWDKELQDVWAALKVARTKAMPAIKQSGMLKEIDETAAAAVRDARGGCGIFWGTYLLVERAVDQAKAVKGADPKFRRWNRDGQIGVQLQGRITGAHRAGLPTHMLEDGTDTRLRVLTMKNSPWQPGGPNPNLDNWRLLQIRIGSDGRKPVFAHVPFKLHRPLPEGVITWATVQCKRVALTQHWEVQFIVDEDPLLYDRPKQVPLRKEQVPEYLRPHLLQIPEGSGACGIDMGWRQAGTGLRVAYLVNEDGKGCSLNLPERIIGQLTRPFVMQGYRDDHRNELLRYFREHKEQLVVPEDLDLPTLASNSSFNVLRAYYYKLKDALRDPEIAWEPEQVAAWGEWLERLRGWEVRDRHLYEMSAHLRQRGIRARKNLYMNWALEVCRRYQRVCIEKPFVKRLIEKDRKEDAVIQPVNQQRMLASPGILGECLAAAAAKTGSEIRLVDPKHTSQRCVQCGYCAEVGMELFVVCPKCGTAADQDRRAAINLMLQTEKEKEYANT